MRLLVPGEYILDADRSHFAEVVDRLTTVGNQRRFDVVVARRCDDQRLVAVKYLEALLPEENLYADDVRAELFTAKGRLRREAEVSAAVQHPHLLPVEVLIRHDATGFLGVVTPLCLGPILQTYSDGRHVSLIPEPSAAVLLTMVEQVWPACEALHAAGGGHRDVKPSNILIDATGRFVLADLDHATLDKPSETTLTTPGGGFRSAHFTPNEPGTFPQWDAYSLGETLRACLPDQVPSSLAGLLELANAMRQPSPNSRLADGRILRERILNLRRSLQIAEVIPHDLLGFIAPERLATDVQRALLIQARSRVPVIPRPAAPLPRRWIIAAASIGPLIFLTGFLVWRVWGPIHPKPEPCAPSIATQEAEKSPGLQEQPAQSSPLPMREGTSTPSTQAETMQILDAMHKSAYRNSQESLIQSAAYQLQRLQGVGQNEASPSAVETKK